MNILIAYYSKTGSTERVAIELQQHLLKKGSKVRLARIFPTKELKAYQYKKNGKSLKLKQPLLDVKFFDLVVVGTPVWNFCPTPIILSYLRSMRNVKGKRFALFATCTALPGTTIQRMGNILTTNGATVLNSLTIRSIFALDEPKLAQARLFGEALHKLLS